MSALTLYAGPAALDWIRNHGLRPEHVKVMVGASGGPKWFVLYGLDRYLAASFLAARTEPLAGTLEWRYRFEPLGEGRTRLTQTSLVDSFEGRDAMVASGMEHGIREGHERLDELLAA